MRVIRGLFTPLPHLETPVVTLGAFDGVHRGHQRILAATLAWAAELRGASVVLTFDPLPKAVIGRCEALCLTSLPHRLALLGRSGVDLIVVAPFDAALARMPAEDFIRRVLLGWLGARHLVFGHDSTFGHRGEGNLSLLRRLEAEGVLSVRSPAPVRYRGQIISSTAIRRAIAEGNLRAAAAMLGRPFSLLGTVVRGKGRGARLGFPTANLDLHHEVIPPHGIYAATTELDGQVWPALVYVGRCPTFHQADAPTSIEVHVIDYQGDLYGREIEVQFITKLRDDTRFPSAEALIAQMHADRRAALAVIRRRTRARRPST